MLRNFLVCLGAVRKNIHTKSRNTDLFFLRVRTGSTSLVRADHKFQNIRRFLHQKVQTSRLKTHSLPLVRNMSTLDNFPPPECGRLLGTAS